MEHQKQLMRSVLRLAMEHQKQLMLSVLRLAMELQKQLMSSDPMANLHTRDGCNHVVYISSLPCNQYWIL